MQGAVKILVFLSSVESWLFYPVFEPAEEQDILLKRLLVLREIEVNHRVSISHSANWLDVYKWEA